MDAIEQRKVLLLEMPGYRLISGDHEFFDDSVGDAALGAHDILRHPLDVEDNFCFGEIEIQVPAGSAALVHQECQLFHEFELIHEIPITLQMLRILVHQNPPHGSVGHARAATNHRVEEAAADDFAFAVDFHRHGFGEAILVGIQATDTIGESFRKHGDGSIWKIDACRAAVSLLIDGGSRSNVESNVGNRNQKLIVAVGFVHAYGVVKISRQLAVNGNDR